MPKVLSVFWHFLYLGCVSFGGPAAHIGYFRNTFVTRLKWLDEKTYAQLVALSQFLPGPGSSQVGFAIGLRQCGLSGGIAAFLGFTLPSFIIMLVLATLANEVSANPLANGLIYGLKLLAVVVVADACWSMATLFCRSRSTASMAILVALVLIAFSHPWLQVISILVAAALGVLTSKELATKPALGDGKAGIQWLALWVFFVLLICLPILAPFSNWLSMSADFYQTGSLVFGGGHVVLPLLEHRVGDTLSSDQFLTGYALAQAVPGPMFSIASYLGAALDLESPIINAVVATVAIFLPGFLLVIAFSRGWTQLASNPKVAGAITGINAAVVGLLVAAWYDPVLINAIHNLGDVLLVSVGLVLLRLTRIPILLMVLGFAISGAARVVLF